MLAAACGSPPKTATSSDRRSRDEIEAQLQRRLATLGDDPCARAAWLTKLVAGAEGLEEEVAEELKATATQRCALAHAPTPTGRPTETTPTLDVGGPAETAPAKTGLAAPGPAATGAPVPCSHERSDTELRRNPATPRPIKQATIDAWFASCVADRIRACQAALDTSLDAGVTCWTGAPWPEVPPSIDPAAVAQTASCLQELVVVAADLRTCTALKPGTTRDSCVALYVGYAPKCGLLRAEHAVHALPAHEDIERLVAANAEVAAAQAAVIAKESARCHGRTTVDFALKLKSERNLASAPGCRYQVIARVVDHNNAFIQLVDPTSGGASHLLRTKEPFPDGTVISDRVAVFDSIENAEMADGTVRQSAVFKLQPLTP